MCLAWCAPGSSPSVEIQACVAKGAWPCRKAGLVPAVMLPGTPVNKFSDSGDGILGWRKQKLRVRSRPGHAPCAWAVSWPLHRQRRVLPPVVCRGSCTMCLAWCAPGSGPSIENQACGAKGAWPCRKDRRVVRASPGHAPSVGVVSWPLRRQPPGVHGRASRVSRAMPPKTPGASPFNGQRTPGDFGGRVVRARSWPVLLSVGSCCYVSFDVLRGCFLCPPVFSCQAVVAWPRTAFPPLADRVLARAGCGPVCEDSAILTQWACEWCLGRACWQAPCSYASNCRPSFLLSLSPTDCVTGGEMGIPCCLPVPTEFGCRAVRLRSRALKGCAEGLDSCPAFQACPRIRCGHLGARVLDLRLRIRKALWARGHVPVRLLRFGFVPGHVRRSCPVLDSPLPSRCVEAHAVPTSRWNATWLILPVVICLSQRLSHACVSMNKFGL